MAVCQAPKIKESLRYNTTNSDLFDFNLDETEMAEIAALNKNKRYYTSTPELLASYAAMVPPVDEQK